ncbi:hypothetical protein NDU88_001266 [Pleurodeles waltl]|uniref:Uncharacterized protein n=1 Tax=Pleurodeles waltl TaxID=8319 RepID=A0AAV7Q3T8_PLEWA|nr:hypothetical protein NDU88_001266 [Pleurodeles waltl]
MVTPLQLGSEMRLRGVGIQSCFQPDPAGEGSLPAARQRDQGRRRMPIGRLNTDGDRAASRGQEPAITAPLRLGQETRLRESGDLVQRLSHPAERGSPPAGPKTQKSALGCLSAKAVRLRGQARRRGPGRQLILGPRAQGSKASTNPQKPCPSRQGQGRSSEEGGHPRERGESGFTLKSELSYKQPKGVFKRK